MSVYVPTNPFATRFTRPDAVAFQWQPRGSDPWTVASRTRDRSSCSQIPLQSGWSTDTAAFCQTLLQHLQRERLGLIVGPHGSGKTTLLYTLLPHLASAFGEEWHGELRVLQLTMPLTNSLWTRVKHARDSARVTVDCLGVLPRESLLVIDGVEQLALRDLKRIARMVRKRGLFLLATSHTNLARIAVLHETAVDVMLIRSLADRLLAGAPGAVSQIVLTELERRDLSRLTNVRKLWFELYDIVQNHLLADPMKTRNALDGCPLVSGHDSHLTGDAER
jgi:energy-coupling factor transporter ATP-binding protein EcfA2